MPVEPVRPSPTAGTSDITGATQGPGLLTTGEVCVTGGCKSAGIGCLECKQPVIDAINAELKPIRERAAQILDLEAFLGR